MYFSNADPIKRQGVETRINSRLADANNAIAHQIIELATDDLNVLLNGGTVAAGPLSLKFLGLKQAQQVLQQAEAQAKDPEVRRQIHQVLVFAQRGVTGLNFASPALASIEQPLRAHKIAVGGRRVSLTDFGIAVAPAVTLMFVGILLGAGMLAMEREENTFGRLVRGLVSRWGLLSEKVVLAMVGGVIVALLELVMISIFVSLTWGRVGVWLLGLVVGGLAFGAVGTLIGARDARRARGVAAGVHDRVAVRVPRLHLGRRGVGRPVQRDPRDLGPVPVPGDTPGNERGDQRRAARDWPGRSCTCWR